DLVQQRLKQMIIAAIDDRDPDIALLQGPRRTQSSKPRADDHDMRTLGHATLISSASNGKLRARQASTPPARGRTFLMPFFLSRRAMRAAVTSLGQAQYRMTSRSRGISWCR